MSGDPTLEFTDDSLTIRGEALDELRKLAQQARNRHLATFTRTKAAMTLAISLGEWLDQQAARSRRRDS